jgi:hypothetical protein
MGGRVCGAFWCSEVLGGKISVNSGLVVFLGTSYVLLREWKTSAFWHSLVMD